ncbi:transmembrane protein, putative [Medicago truncatula]|uniref:Transmembrane protein, putative n=1 Tax=Medicago truncatula TaxID=3880 RepID=G7L4C2_MEDTR|nr:transmembrane protein, putative [Medicago truncatula]
MYNKIEEVSSKHIDWPRRRGASAIIQCLFTLSVNSILIVQKADLAAELHHVEHQQFNIL